MPSCSDEAKDRAVNLSLWQHVPWISRPSLDDGIVNDPLHKAILLCMKGRASYGPVHSPDVDSAPLPVAAFCLLTDSHDDTAVQKAVIIQT